MTAGVSAPEAEPLYTVPRWLRLLLLVVALTELLGGLMALPALVADWPETPAAGTGGSIIVAALLLRPVLAVAALVSLKKDRLQPALYALAAIAMLAWASMMPSVAASGLQLEQADAAWRAALVFEVFLKPVLVVMAAALAALRKAPVVAGVLAAAPAVFGWIGVLVFAAAVAVHGF